MSCKGIKATCTGTKTWAVCTQYESSVNSDSSLDDSTCLSIEETTQDIYDQLEGMSTEGLGELCLTYTLSEGKLLVKNVLKKFEEKICELEEQIENLQNTALCDMPIGTCVDVSCLSDACNNPITTFGQLMQALVDNACNP